MNPTDHPTAHLDAERGPPPRTSPDLLPNDRAALDAAMAELGFSREPRYREGDMVEAIARQHLAMRLKCGHTDHRTPGPEVFREAMNLLGYVPADRYNARALGRACADTFNALHDARMRVADLEEDLSEARAEIARLSALLPPAGDEPTEEAPAPEEVFDVPAGLTVAPLHPSTPAAKAGAMWWFVSLDATGGVLLRCLTAKATRAALDVLGCVSWVGPDYGHEGYRTALEEAAALEGVSRGVFGRRVA